MSSGLGIRLVMAALVVVLLAAVVQLAVARLCRCECPPCEYSDGMELPGPPPTVLITETQVPCRSCYDQQQ